ncbi:MAG: hypothetical protein WBV41_06120, partial [Terriglobales bacterium]
MLHFRTIFRTILRHYLCSDYGWASVMAVQEKCDEKKVSGTKMPDQSLFLHAMLRKKWKLRVLLVPTRSRAWATCPV